MFLNVQNKELSYESYKLIHVICNRTAMDFTCWIMLNAVCVVILIEVELANYFIKQFDD
jgi:hypothetical protein